VAAAAGWGVRLALGALAPIPLAAVVLTAFGAVYFLVTDRLAVPESGALLRRLRPGEPRDRADG
jgi:hypothetical protein